MVREGQSLPVSTNRVSPYQLRSCRRKKEKEVADSPLESENASEWEDVRCVICMEPPHNAVLLQCTSFSQGCRAYLCDTSSRHSNCFKQYRINNKKNTRRYSNKTLSCPYCRGKVSGTMKPTSARRFMNAKPRKCSVDECDFSGTFSQLKTHLKIEHPGWTPPRLDHSEQHMWGDLVRVEEQQLLELERDEEQLNNTRQRNEAEQRVMSPPHYQHPRRHPMMSDVSFSAFMPNLVTDARGQANAASYPAHMPRLEFHGTICYPRVFPDFDP